MRSDGIEEMAGSPRPRQEADRSGTVVSVQLLDELLVRRRVRCCHVDDALPDLDANGVTHGGFTHRCP